MNKFNILSRLVRKVKGSLLWKVGMALFVFSLATNLANIVNLIITCSKTFVEYYNDQLDKKMETVVELNDRKVRDYLEYMKQLPHLNPNISKTLSMGGELSYVRRTMQSEMSVRGLKGYLLGDAAGHLKRTNFTDYTEEQKAYMEDLFAYLAETPEHTYKGIYNVLNQGLCMISVCTMPDTLGNIGCYAVACHSSLEDDKQMKELADLAQINCSIVRDGVCKASSMGDLAVGQPLSQEWIADTCANGGIARMVDHVGDATFISSYIPIKDHRGQMVGIWATSVDADMSSQLTKTLVFWTVAIATVVGIVVFVLILYYFRLRLVRPVEKLANSAKQIAVGDLSKNVDITKTGDEVQALGESMSEMHASLYKTINQLLQTAKLLHSTSQELSRSAGGLSDGANKQAASLEEISSSLEQMTGNIHQNTDNSQMTDRLMTETDNAIMTIAEASSANLSATKKIATSIKNINALVGQTNILSLNAAVEAARAGSKGRGFAVVAREVGRLAEQTKNTAKDVGDTAHASIEGTENINQLIDNLVPRLHRCATLVKEIATSSAEQGIGADQINIAISSLNQVTQESAANAEEIAANAVELQNTAESMKKLVDLFKI